jgi:negative regulator of sigma E activity
MMNEELSALMDGELESSDAKRVLSQVANSAEARLTWERMCVTRTVIRQEDTLLAGSGFSDAVMAKLDQERQEPPAETEQPRRSKVIPLRPRRWNRSVGRLALAASIAAAAVIILNRPGFDDGATKVASAPAADTVNQSAASAGSSQASMAGSGTQVASSSHTEANATKEAVASTSHTASKDTKEAVARRGGTGDTHRGQRAAAQGHNFDIRNPDEAFNHHFMRASTPDWSKLIGSDSSQLSYTRATGSAAWQLQRSMMGTTHTHHHKSAKKDSKDTDDDMANSIGFLLMQDHSDSGYVGTAVVSASSSH